MESRLRAEVRSGGKLQRLEKGSAMGVGDWQTVGDVGDCSYYVTLRLDGAM